MSQDDTGTAAAELPTSPHELLADLQARGIETRTVEHDPVFTVEESQALRGSLPGGHAKSLFLRDKKKNFWLVVAPEDRPVDLKALGRLLGGRLSFGDSEKLWHVLGVRPGAVTPFAVINDTEQRVKVILDEQLMAEEPLNFHPLDNSMTTAIARDDLLRFLRETGHRPEIRDLAEAGGENAG